MPETHPATLGTAVPAGARLADRLVAARRSRFVGREAELALFRQALLQETPPFVVLHIHGPGGVGKTALLRCYMQMATEAGRCAIFVDGRNMEASPTGLLIALRQALGLAVQEDSAAIPEFPAGSVLFLDTYERVAAVDSWLRTSLLPQLPAQCLVVIAGRNPPAVAWYTDLDWAALTRIVPLRNLRPEESQTFLTTRGVPAASHADLLAVTHGHPLALCLIADAFAQGKTVDDLALHKQPDLVRVLLENFVDEIPSANHRLALEICVMVWATTEAMLAAVMDAEEAHAAFEWLRRLPFIEPGSEGLFPHDLARETLDVDYRWRNAEAHRHLYKELIHYLYAQMHAAGGVQQKQQRIWFDIFYLARHNSYMAPFFDWRAIGDSYAEAATAADLPPILAMVRRHEGAEQAKLVAYWFGRQPRAFRVYRNGNAVVGFMAHLALHEATAEDIATDPALPAALNYVAQHGPAQPGEEIMHLRFWMGRDAHQGVSTAINLTAINATIYWTTHPKLAWNFIATHDPDYLRPHFTMINIRRTPDADFVVGGHRYAVFSHDWRVQNAEDWLELKVDRYGLTEVDLATLEELEAMQPLPPAPTPPVIVLSEPEFADAVRRALRDYTRTDMLAANPLLRSRIVLEKGMEDAVAALRALLCENVTMLKQNPKDKKLYRAVWHTYFEPAPTQESTAELLDLPFSTYRYHLTHGVDRIVSWLWQAEINGKAR